MSRRTRESGPRRDAFVMIAVIALLFVVSSLATAWTIDALRSRRQERLRLMHRQAEWLAEAALGRAAIRSQDNPDYRGEVWRVGSNEIKQSFAATIDIRIETLSDGARRIHAEAAAPEGPAPRVRHTAILIAPADADSTTNMDLPSR